MSIYKAFERSEMKQVHERVKKHFPNLNPMQDAWVWHAGRGHWEFHGPDKFYWHGRAGGAWHARAKGWDSYLTSKGFSELDQT